MFCINNLNLKVTDVELIKSSYNKYDETINDTYSIFIGSMENEIPYSITFYTTTPRKTFYNLKENEKTLINSYLDYYDIEIQINDKFSIEDLDNNEVYLTKISDTLFEIEMVISSKEFDETSIYIKTNIDLEKDVFKK